MKKTIGVLVSSLDHQSGGYEFELREGFEAACRTFDVDLLIIAGGLVEPRNPSLAAQNVIYELIGRGSVDGLVIVAGGLSHHIGPDGIQRFCDRYKPLPICSVGLHLDGFPGVVVDNRPGMEALVEHIVGEHGCRRIAFLAGPQANRDSSVRLDTFREVLARHGLTHDPELVRYSDFTMKAGADLTTELLARGIELDAIIAANDSLALGAVESLKEHGLRVPDDVRVTGFDDLLVTRLADPPISTVQQPLRDQASLAVKMVIDQIAGRAVPSQTVLAAEFLARESCGCKNPELDRSFVPAPQPAADPMTFLARNRARIFGLLNHTQQRSVDLGSQRAARILGALEGQLQLGRDRFIAELESISTEIPGDNEVFEDLQRALSVLHEEFEAVSTPELERLWHRARRRLCLVNTRSQVRQRSNLELMYERLLRTGERFSTALDARSLQRALTEELPAAQVRNAIVWLREEGPQPRLKPFLCLRDGQEYPLQTPARREFELLPEEAVTPGRRRTWFAFPLSFEAEHLGVAIFESGPSAAVYEMLSDQLSTALKTAAMHAEIVRRTAAHERSMQERLATAERMKSLSVLAGGVAHDLNNALGPLVALPDVIRQELDELLDSRLAGKPDLLSDLNTIKSAALRAVQTIKDLLALGRQGHVSKDYVDLNAIVGGLSSASTRGLSGSGEGANVQFRLWPEPLFVHASESHISRAVSNLIRNAVEATDPSGSVTVTTSLRKLTEACPGYEVVDPGEYAVVTVSDTGHGIPKDLIGRIFEPFFSKKKLHDSSGSGLGLAIVHGVVKEHGGFVNVESTVGKGTTFTLYVPHALRVEVQAHKDSSIVPRGSARILVIDDDPVQLRTSRRVLSRLGYEVTTVDNASQAYALLFGADSVSDDFGPAMSAASPFDLLLIDMILKEQEDGLSVFHRIRRRFPSQRGLLVSGHAPTERGALALQGGFAFLSKPYTAQKLAQAVHAALHASTPPRCSERCIADQSKSPSCLPIAPPSSRPRPLLE